MSKFNKAPPNPRGGHVRLHWDLLDSNAWRCLTASDQRVYIALLRGLKGSNNGDLALSLSMAKPHGVKSQTTLAKSLLALVAVGLIAVTREGGCKAGGQRLATLYRATDLPVFEMPAKHIEASTATNEWRAITTLAHGHALIDKAETRAKAEYARKQAEKTKSQVQMLGVTAPNFGGIGSKTSPKNGRWPLGPVQKLDLAKSAESAGEPITTRVSA
jgi:predicted transcriptional regulator